MIDPVELQVLTGALRAICEEMGAVLIRSAHSANIKERRDASTALFDARGDLQTLHGNVIGAGNTERDHIDGDAEASLAVLLGWYDGHDPRELLEQELVAGVRPGPDGETFLEVQATFRPTRGTTSARPSTVNVSLVTSAWSVRSAKAVSRAACAAASFGQ